MELSCQSIEQIRRREAMKERNVLTKIITWALSLCMILALVGFVPASLTTATSPHPIDQDDDLDPQEGARQFDEAINDVGTILTLDLTKEEGAKKANAIFAKNARKLALAEKKAIAAALRNSAFERGLQAEAAKREGGKKALAKELEANPELVASIAGAEEAARAIKESTRPAIETLQRVSEALKKAADAKGNRDGTSQGHHSRAAKTANAFPIEHGTSIEAENLCVTQPAICQLLYRIALGYLADRLRSVTSGSMKNCVLSAYKTWQSCTAGKSVWDILICNYKFGFAVNVCIAWG